MQPWLAEIESSTVCELGGAAILLGDWGNPTQFNPLNQLNKKAENTNLGQFADLKLPDSTVVPRLGKGTGAELLRGGVTLTSPCH